MSGSFKDLSYDCIVQFIKYNGFVQEGTPYNENFVYEVERGLVSVSVNLSKDSVGSASIAINVPTTTSTASADSVSSVKGYNDNVLIRRKKILKELNRQSNEVVKILSFVVPKTKTTFSLVGGSVESSSQVVSELSVEEIAEIIVTDFPLYKYETRQDMSLLIANINSDNAKLIKNNKIKASTRIKIKTNVEKFYEEVFINDGIASEALSGDTKKMPSDNVDQFGNEITYYPILDSTRTQCFFKPMDKVSIWMTGRFQDPGKKSNPEYNKVFVGVVTSSAVNYQNGTYSVSISCSDIMQWLNWSYYNINPAVDQKTFVSYSAGGSNITPFTTNLAGLSPGMIIKLLTVGGNAGTQQMSRVQYKAAYDATTGDKKEKVFKVDQFQIKYLTYDKDRDLEGAKVLTTKSLPSDPDDQDVLDHEEVVEYEAKQKQPKLHEVQYLTPSMDVNGCGFVSLSEKKVGTEKSAPPEQINKDGIFGKDVLYIDPNLLAYVPYNRMFKGTFALWDHEYKTRYEICQDICTLMEAEFYMDCDGVLNFKPPFYNLNPGILYRRNKSEKPDTEKKEDYEVINGDQYLILDCDIISTSFTEDGNDILNYYFISGQVEYIGDLNVATATTTIKFNKELIRRFGIRVGQKKLPFAGAQEHEQQREDWAIALMNRANAKYKKGNLSIALRPELHLGRTVAILGDVDTTLGSSFSPENFNPFQSQDRNICLKLKNLMDLASSAINIDVAKFAKGKVSENVKRALSDIMVYYISGISHSWNPGGFCQTSLTLTHGRYWDQSFGDLKFFMDEPYFFEANDPIYKTGNSLIKQYSQASADLSKTLGTDLAYVANVNSEEDIQSMLQKNNTPSEPGRIVPVVFNTVPTIDLSSVSSFIVRSDVKKRDKLSTEMALYDLRELIVRYFLNEYTKSNQSALERPERIAFLVLQNFPDLNSNIVKTWCEKEYVSLGGM